MIIVTGGAGFIGSNLVHALNADGIDEILVIDDLTDGSKSSNLADARIVDYLDWREAADTMSAGGELASRVETVFHLGACSDTTEWDGHRMMVQNYRFSRLLFRYATRRRLPLVYASSAAVYGTSRRFNEVAANERPLNMYGYSKLAFDQYVRQHLPALRSPVVGLRYFNVYGPREQHKGRMASVAWHFNAQLESDGEMRLFGASHGVAAGEQQRDFVHVDDVVDVTRWCAQLDANKSGVYNCGTGRSATFNELAEAIRKWHGRGTIAYRDFPSDLEGAYQAFTRADMSALRGCGYTDDFLGVSDGVKRYLDWLAARR